MLFNAAAVVDTPEGDKLIMAEIIAPDRGDAEIAALGQWSRRGTIRALAVVPAKAEKETT